MTEQTVVLGAHHTGHIARRIFGSTLTHIVLLLGGLAMVGPFLWMLSTSLKTDAQAYIFPPEWIPSPIVWQNYVRVWTDLPFARFFFNSTLVAIAVTAGQLLTSSLGAYAFARLDFPGRDRLFLLYLAMMMIPFQVTMIPVFILARWLGMVDNYSGLIVPLLFSPYATFMLRQFFKTIPKDLEDAATIDGASYFRIYSTIIMPLSKPALAALGIFVFMFSWNNFQWPLIITNSLEMKTLPLGLTYFQGQYAVYWNLLMAGTSITVIPVLVVFFFAQRYFIEGITLTGLKG